MSVYQETTGFLIHQRKFRDNSLIIDFFCKSSGKLGLVAKGLHRNRSLSAQIKPFSLLKIQYFGKSQLKTLTDCNILDVFEYPDLQRNTAALYINELLHYTLLEGEPVAELFSAYTNALRSMQNSKLSSVLRKFELAVLKYNGMEIEVSESDSRFIYVNSNHGIQISEIMRKDSCRISEIYNLINEKTSRRDEMLRVNKFMHSAVDVCLSGRRIYSRELLKSLYR